MTSSVSVSLDRGDEAKCTITWVDDAGTLTDPTEAEIRVMDPEGTITSYLLSDDDPIVTRVSLGVYRAVFPLTMSGRWRIRWVASGDLIDETEDTFLVKHTSFPAT